MAVVKALPVIFDTLINFEYKKFVISCSYVYYYTIFFLVLRVLIYSGITLINLINTKHTTFYKKKSVRTLSSTLLKFYNVVSSKKILLKIVTVKYL